MTSSPSSLRVAARYLGAAPGCKVCGEPGEEIRYTVKGKTGMVLSGRIFLKGTVLCESHAEMCDNP